MPKTSRLSYSGFYKSHNREKLKFTQQTTVLWMPISIGQPYHESDSLCDVLELLVKHFINRPLVKVVIADTAQRYSLAIKNKETPDAMRDLANKKGNIWEEGYKDLIKNKFKESQVIYHRWDEWTNHELYEKARQEIDSLYSKKDSAFYNAIESDVLKFEKRYSERENISFSDKEREYCRECLKEECAVLIVWGKILVHPGYCCIFYPKPMTDCILFINEKYTCFMSMFSELKSKSKSKLSMFYTNSSTENTSNDQASSFLKINPS
ncbi:hypothetical protein [Rickettsiella massiliensis]|uniref:hypothetical protein n=1 Tax=Rickettsiella massiliensis TaxID=676517 RepID=UPI00029ACCEF|nr:hypothetical protein [Rickettsiella massiliensis]